jgi:hypothetical protein
VTRFVAATFMVLALTISASAINLKMTAADIERALIIARDRDAERARFHAAYVSNLNDPFVQTVEIITEFRRVVLLAEERLKKGDRGFAYSSRLVADALAPWKNSVAVRAQLRFHPQNTYVDLPMIALTLDGPSADKALVSFRKDPINALATGEPGERIPIMGAHAEALYDASLIGQTRRTLSVKIDGKDVSRTTVDFARVE